MTPDPTARRNSGRAKNKKASGKQFFLDPKIFLPLDKELHRDELCEQMMGQVVEEHGHGRYVICEGFIWVS